jgi:hypothetical protein
VAPVEVTVKAAWSWVTEPVDGPVWSPDESVLDALLGVDVQQAALAANAAGWIVQGCEPEAVVTADYRHNRLSLTYDPATGEVLRVWRG